MCDGIGVFLYKQSGREEVMKVKSFILVKTTPQGYLHWGLNTLLDIFFIKKKERRVFTRMTVLHGYFLSNLSKNPELFFDDSPGHKIFMPVDERVERISELDQSQKVLVAFFLNAVLKEIPEKKKEIEKMIASL